MIAIEQRILIVSCLAIISLLISAVDIFSKASFGQRCTRFLISIAFFFPFIDFKLPPAEMNIKLWDAMIFFFIAINIKSLHSQLQTITHKSVVLFVLFLCVLAVISPFFENSLFAILKFVMELIIVAIILIAIRHNSNIYSRIFEKIIVWALIFFILQLLFGLDFSLHHELNQISIRDRRFTSFSQDPQKLAQIQYMLAIIYLGWIFHSRNNLNIKNIFLILVCITIGLATGSRAGLMGFLLSLFLLFIVKFNIKTILLTVFGAIAMYISMDLIMSIPVFQRMNEFNNSFEGRFDFFWIKAFAIFLENFWTGVGFGNFAEYVSIYHSSFVYGSDGPTVDQPESGYLLWLVETGIIGGLFYLWFLIRILRKKVAIGMRPFKLAFVVWMVGSVTIYSLSDVKVLFLVLFCIGALYSDSINRKTS